MNRRSKLSTEERRALKYQVRRTGVPLDDDGEVMMYRLPYDPAPGDGDAFVDFPGHTWVGGREVFIDVKYGTFGLTGRYESDRDVLEGFAVEARRQVEALRQQSPQARLEWQCSNKRTADILRVELVKLFV